MKYFSMFSGIGGFELIKTSIRGKDRAWKASLPKQNMSDSGGRYIRRWHKIPQIEKYYHK